MTAFPGSEASFTGFTASHTLAADSHASQHNLEQAEIIATQHKIGTGSSTPTSAKLLRGNGVGTSAWAQADLTTDVTGVLPQANGGTGTTLATGTGKAVYDTAPTVSNPTLTGGGSWAGSPTLTTPTIADFTNAGHNHQGTAGGTVLDERALVMRNNQALQAKNSTGTAVNVMTLANDNYLRLHQLPRQDDTTNSTKTNILVQYGYGVFTTGVASVKTETVTFPVAYSSLPIVMATYGGDDTAGSSSLGQGGQEDQTAYAYATSVTTTNFLMRATATSNWAAGTTAFYHWVAIGEA